MSRVLSNWFLSLTFQAMAIINGCLYVFGGTTGYIYSTDLHKLDLNTREWIQLKPNNMSCDMPEERWEAGQSRRALTQGSHHLYGQASEHSQSSVVSCEPCTTSAPAVWCAGGCRDGLWSLCHTDLDCVVPEQSWGLGAAGECWGGEETPVDPCPLSYFVARHGQRRAGRSIGDCLSERRG